MKTRIALTIALALIVGGCFGPAKIQDLNKTLAAYGNVIRWMEIENAISYMHPETREEQLPSELELSRWAQFRVSGYRQSPVQMVGENEAHQTVEISLTNRHTMGEKVVRDRQVWTYDEETKHWYLSSGLPDISGSGR